MTATAPADTVLAPDPKLSLDQFALAQLVEWCKYPGFTFHTRPQGDGLLAWAAFTGDGQEWTTRRQYLNPRMTRGEVVQTMLLIVLIAVEHEAREHFTFRGDAVYAPHFDPEDLRRLTPEAR